MTQTASTTDIYGSMSAYVSAIFPLGGSAALHPAMGVHSEFLGGLHPGSSAPELGCTRILVWTPERVGSVQVAKQDFATATQFLLGRTITSGYSTDLYYPHVSFPHP